VGTVKSDRGLGLNAVVGYWNGGEKRGRLDPARFETIPLGEFYNTSDRNPLKRASELSKVPTGNRVRANQQTNAMVPRI
jgi:hypothetical protein